MSLKGWEVKVSPREYLSKNVEELRSWWSAEKIHCLRCGMLFGGHDVVLDRADGTLICPTVGCAGRPDEWVRGQQLSAFAGGGYRD